MNQALERVAATPNLFRSALAGAGVGLGLALLAQPAPTGVCKADFPAAKWRNHDLSMLDGCWHRFSNMITIDINSGMKKDTRNWLLCFDKNGQGRQSLTWTDDVSCQGLIHARFAGDVLVIDADICHGGSRYLLAETYHCTRRDARVSDCLGLAQDPRYRREKSWASAADGLFRR